MVLVFESNNFYKYRMRKISKPAIEKVDSPASPTKNPATRDEILDLLKRRGALCAGALGVALKRTAMAVRLQLYELEKDGLVTARSEARGRGRPVKLWTLTESSASVFPDAHQALAVEMINSVEELFGPEGLARFIRQHGDKQRAAYGAKLSSARSLGERVKRLAKARADEGYMAEAKQDGADWLLIENHCPICSAAKACTRLCAGELEVFSDVLGKDVAVAREEHILAGARRCCYRVKERE